MIPESFIQDVLTKVDVVEIVGRYVNLRKAGANLLGLCPFHNEKSPSFTVSPVKQFYHCFGCGVHGTAIRFIMDYAGASFPEAVRQLAQGIGLQVPVESHQTPQQTRAYKQEQQAKDQLTTVLDQANQYYRQQLKQAPLAIEYLKQRGLSGQIAGRFGLGWAPDNKHALQAVFADHYTDEALINAGLVVLGEDGRSHDRFRGRVTFPIHNDKGKLIGFGARTITDQQPKYLNSPETPLFSKGKELYGLWEGRRAIQQAKKVLVVEGYMDVVALAQQGIEYSVATLGTATTQTHLQKLFRVSTNIIFSFDGDKAGRNAAKRALETSLTVLRDDITLSFLFLPEGHDPDSYVRTLGVSAFNDLLERALPLSSFLLEVLTDQHDLTSAQGRAKCAHAARPWLQAMPESILRMQIVREFAQLVKLTDDEIKPILNLQDQPSGSFVESVRRVADTDGVVLGPAHTQSREQAPAPRHKHLQKKTAPFKKKTAESLATRFLRLLLIHPFLSHGLTNSDLNLLERDERMGLVLALVSVIQRTGATTPSVLLELAQQDTELFLALQRASIDSLMEEELPDPEGELSATMLHIELYVMQAELTKLLSANRTDDLAKHRFRLLSQRTSDLKKTIMSLDSH